MKRRLRLIFGLVISLLSLYYVLRVIDPSKLWETYRGAKYIYMLPALLLVFFTSWARAYRWRLLMHPNHDLPLPRLFSIVNIGYLFNNVLPAKVGEVVRGYLVGRLIPGGIGQAVSTLLVERLLDVLTVVVLLLILIPFVALPPWAARAGLVFGGISVGGLVGLLILGAFGQRGLDWVWRFVGRIPWVGHPKVRKALENLLEGLKVLTVGKLLPGILLWSALIWLGYALFNYTFLVVFDMTYLPFAAAAFVLCATGFSMVVPSSPGAIGVFEWAAFQALSVYGVEQNLAIGYAFGLHAFTNLVLILLGLWGLRRESLSFSDVRGEALVEPPSAVESVDP
ncbi:MAG: hypothetical protein A2Y73_01585 [Chloroflexi bacterium RBG_13_56_8]|nr:MAG: hypothetical protein A2Y73_01585 [Chloroflexi bacterium RBG_13_56_8]